MEGILRRADAVCRFTTTALLIALALALFAQVVLRNVFSLGPAWLEETARLLHVGMVFLAMPLLEREKLQVKIDFVVDRLPAGVGRLFRLFAMVATIAFAIFFVVSGALLIKKTGDMKMPGTGLPNAVLLVPVVIGMLLFALASVAALLTQCSALDEGEVPE